MSTDSEVQSSFDHHDCDGDYDRKCVDSVGDAGVGSAVHGHSDQAALVVEPCVHWHVIVLTVCVFRSGFAADNIMYCTVCVS
jgi:hypothetical protein